MHEHDEAITRVYQETVGLLRYLARAAFDVPADDVEPLVQETFLAFVAQIATVRDAKSWLVGALRNTCRHYWRDAARRHLAVDIDQCREAAVNDHGTAVVAAVTAQKILGELSMRDRHILVQFYVAGHTSATIAAATGTTVGTVENALHRTRRRAQRVARTLAGLDEVPE